MSWTSPVDGLTAADVMHGTLSTLPADSTVADLRAYFATSSSRRMALLADGRRFAGALTPDDLPADADDAAPAADFAAAEPSIAPDVPAAQARDAALQQPSRRLPVVDAAGDVLGIVAITKDRSSFCGV